MIQQSVSAQVDHLPPAVSPRLSGFADHADFDLEITTRNDLPGGPIDCLTGVETQVSILSADEINRVMSLLSGVNAAAMFYLRGLCPQNRKPTDELRVRLTELSNSAEFNAMLERVGRMNQVYHGTTTPTVGYALIQT